MKFLSAIFKLYRRNSEYISDFHDISAQLKLYQRFLQYIDLPTKTDKKEPHSKKVLQNKIWSTFFIKAYFPASIFSNAVATCSSVNSCCIT
ncbi:hypothetical protein CN272_05655 [Bacillus anthracis]|nr:hypothetical protein CN272_05655 [Bacillus anthracis]